MHNVRNEPLHARMGTHLNKARHWLPINLGQEEGGAAIAHDVLVCIVPNKPLNLALLKADVPDVAPEDLGKQARSLDVSQNLENLNVRFFRRNRPCQVLPLIHRGINVHEGLLTEK